MDEVISPRSDFDAHFEKSLAVINLPMSGRSYVFLVDVSFSWIISSPTSPTLLRASHPMYGDFRDKNQVFSGIFCRDGMDFSINFEGTEWIPGREAGEALYFGGDYRTDQINEDYRRHSKCDVTMLMWPFLIGSKSLWLVNATPLIGFCPELLQLLRRNDCAAP